MGKDSEETRGATGSRIVDSETPGYSSSFSRVRQSKTRGLPNADRILASTSTCACGTQLDIHVGWGDRIESLGGANDESGGDTTAARLEHGFRLALSRSPSEAETQLLQRGFERRLAEFRGDLKASASLARDLKQRGLLDETLIV
jgi:hypothetical protein